MSTACMYTACITQISRRRQPLCIRLIGDMSAMHAAYATAATANGGVLFFTYTYAVQMGTEWVKVPDICAHAYV